MPARRTFAPNPMNEAHVNAHGHPAQPPGLAQPPQPLPPPSAPQPAAPGMPQSPMNAVPPQRPPLPASIPLQMAPPQPQQPPKTGGTVTPLNADPMLTAQEGNASSPLPEGAALLKMLGMLGHTAG